MNNQDKKITLLLDEQPLFLLHTLAALLGVSQAIFIQQLHYWIQISGKEIDERRWIYNSLEEWGKQFPFWKKDSLHRLIKKLVDMKIIIVGNYNKKGYDRTRWYSIDYEVLNNLASSEAISHNREMDFAKTRNAFLESEKPIPYTTTDIYKKKDFFSFSAYSFEPQWLAGMEKAYSLTQDEIQLQIEAAKEWAEDTGRKVKSPRAFMRNWLKKTSENKYGGPPPPLMNNDEKDFLDNYRKAAAGDSSASKESKLWSKEKQQAFDIWLRDLAKTF